MNKDTMTEYKKEMKLAMSLDKPQKKIKIKEIKKWLKKQKGQSWHKMIEENSKNSQLFKLTKNLARAGKISFEDASLEELKSKNPIVERNIK